MAAPENVVQLVERFVRNIDDYRSGKYNETQVRIEFVDPLFKALGWDVDNEQGHAERYKDVIHEDAVKIGGSTKAPDYSFRIGGLRKFFVETKKPSVNLKDDTAPAYQVRRYAWSAKLPVSILTDFEEFAVYDCRNRPAKTDNAATGRVMYLNYKDYIDQWDMLYDTYSREAVLKGAFDKFVEEFKTARGTQEVDAAFLTEIERWRDELARNLALRNEDLNQRELNFAVQRTIDRIIFLRIAEDRGIEPYQQLSDYTKGEDVYQSLMRLFQRADDRYNSGLFHFKEEKRRGGYPDYLTPALKLDNRVLKGILSNLYYPDSPYEFSVLPAEILGQVYEQFLGKVIRLTAGHQAKIEEKPEVKKAGGVYYTPTYIVDYIVQHTVGKSVEAKTPRQVKNIRILDPACGSGSFLLGAYQYLLDWHLEYYLGSEVKSHKNRIVQVGEGDYRLTTGERKRILLNNIYGVDIDSQAVEVTKLSLLLKVLEGENQQQLELRPERVLPDLGNNVKCGNSLIGTDFYEGEQMGMFEMDAEERLRINAFDWDTEFAEIMRAGGFDVVIGNPPYGASLSKEELDYLVEKYPEAKKFPDSYCLFMLKGLSIGKKSGLFSFIVPNTFCDLENCDNFRLWLLNNHGLLKLWQTGWAFKSAIVDTLVFLFINSTPNTSSNIEIIIDNEIYQRSLESFLSNDLYKFDYRNTQNDRKILRKVADNTVLLRELATVKAGVKMYEKGKGNPSQTARTLKERPFSVKGDCPKYWRILYRGKDVHRYELSKPSEYVNYGPWLAAPRNPELFESPKILMRRTDDHLMVCLEEESSISVNSCHVIKLKEEVYSHLFLLGLINSKLLQIVFEIQNPQMVSKVFAEIKVVYVLNLPIRIVNFNDPGDKAQHEKIVSLVESMLSLHKQLAASATPHEQTALQRQIDATDNQIDGLVYELYGLTEEEIKIVEGSVG